MDTLEGCPNDFETLLTVPNIAALLVCCELEFVNKCCREALGLHASAIRIGGLRCQWGPSQREQLVLSLLNSKIKPEKVTIYSPRLECGLPGHVLKSDSLQQGGFFRRFQDLTLAGCDLEGSLPEALKLHPQLTSLSLWSCKWAKEDTILIPWASLPLLTTLNLKGTRAHYEPSPCLGLHSASQLRSLITDDWLKTSDIALLASLTSLTLDGDEWCSILNGRRHQRFYPCDHTAYLAAQASFDSELEQLSGLSCLVSFCFLPTKGWHSMRLNGSGSPMSHNTAYLPPLPLQWHHTLTHLEAPICEVRVSDQVLLFSRFTNLTHLALGCLKYSAGMLAGFGDEDEEADEEGMEEDSKGSSTADGGPAMLGEEVRRQRVQHLQQVKDVKSNLTHKTGSASSGSGLNPTSHQTAPTPLLPFFPNLSTLELSETDAGTMAAFNAPQLTLVEGTHPLGGLLVQLDVKQSGRVLQRLLRKAFTWKTAALSNVNCLILQPSSVPKEEVEEKRLHMALQSLRHWKPSFTQGLLPEEYYAAMARYRAVTEREHMPAGDPDTHARPWTLTLCDMPITKELLSCIPKGLQCLIIRAAWKESVKVQSAPDKRLSERAPLPFATSLLMGKVSYVEERDKDAPTLPYNLACFNSLTFNPAAHFAIRTSKFAKPPLTLMNLSCLPLEWQHSFTHLSAPLFGVRASPQQPVPSLDLSNLTHLSLASLNCAPEVSQGFEELLENGGGGWDACGDEQGVFQKEEEGKARTSKSEHASGADDVLTPFEKGRLFPTLPVFLNLRTLELSETDAGTMAAFDAPKLTSVKGTHPLGGLMVELDVNLSGKVLEWQLRMAFTSKTAMLPWVSHLILRPSDLHSQSKELLDRRTEAALQALSSWKPRSVIGSLSSPAVSGAAAAAAAETAAPQSTSSWTLTLCDIPITESLRACIPKGVECNFVSSLDLDKESKRKHAQG